ncbi:MAG: HipA domain-containing protein [Bacteroidaceae bacterium]|nr:HipA domain-containing protein [Bacteroidaceae bacterium]
MTKIDFTNCPRVPGRAYNGANGKKIAVEYEGETWILKFPPNVMERPNDQSYSNSCISEHLGSSIFRKLDIPAQETCLGIHVNGKTKVVCACKDFTSPGIVLHDFCSIKNTVIDSETGGAGTELDDVLNTIQLQTFVDPTLVLQRFWQMFVVDALLGNFDRHNGNWGFLVNQTTGEATLAPVFDCGSCLLPQADDHIMKMCLDNEDEMNARIYSFPASILKLNGRKINYHDFICGDHPCELDEALSVLLPKMKELDIEALVKDTPYITPLQQEFYVPYLSQRRERIFETK